MHNIHHIDGLVQDCSNSIANALELLQAVDKNFFGEKSGGSTLRGPIVLLIMSPYWTIPDYVPILNYLYRANMTPFPDVYMYN